jgi:hypothetical protein
MDHLPCDGVLYLIVNARDNKRTCKNKYHISEKFINVTASTCL